MPWIDTPDITDRLEVVATSLFRLNQGETPNLCISDALDLRNAAHEIRRLRGLVASLMSANEELSKQVESLESELDLADWPDDFDDFDFGFDEEDEDD